MSFELELHLPFFALRCHSMRTGENRRIPIRKVEDLSFLRIKPLAGHRLALYEAQFSLVLSCWNENTWTAYAFEDTDFNDPEEDEEEDEEGYDVHGITLDYVAGVPEPAVPMYNAKEYFIWVLAIRSDKILREWRAVCRVVERAVSRYRVNEHQILCSVLLE